jgi:hypothetical protein
MRIPSNSVCLRLGGFVLLTSKPSSACALLDAPAALNVCFYVPPNAIHVEPIEQAIRKLRENEEN